MRTTTSEISSPWIDPRRRSAYQLTLTPRARTSNVIGRPARSSRVTTAPFADSAPRSRAAAATITAARCGTP